MSQCFHGLELGFELFDAVIQLFESLIQVLGAREIMIL
jgi:hypothetical protein